MTHMTLLDAYWTAQVNMLVLRCPCGRTLLHRSDRARAYCRPCGHIERLERVRARYVAQANMGDEISPPNQGSCSIRPLANPAAHGILPETKILPHRPLPPAPPMPRKTLTRPPRTPQR